jgi:hypothetical protein
MMLFGIFFYFSPMVTSFAYLRGGSLGIRSLKFSYGSSFMAIGGMSGEKFVAHIGLNGYFTFSPPYSNGAFPLKAPTFSSHLGPHQLR